DARPPPRRQREGLPLRVDALHALHRPRTRDEAELARRRLAFEELLVLQVGIARRGREREQERAQPLGEPGELAERYLDALPFRLTEHQLHAIEELDRD